MFWGLIMEPGRCYTQTVKVAFHVSMAALDISTSSDEPAQVMCVFEGRNYLLCTLSKDKQLQCPLDLNFETGTKVSFATNGKSHVHLTGYLTTFEDDDQEEVEEQEEEELVKEKKRPKRKAAEGPPNKKLKNSSLQDVEDESSDSDFDIENCLNKESTLEEESGGEEEEGDEEEDDVDDDDDDEGLEEEEGEEASSLSAEEESEEETDAIKPKQNGVVNVKSTQKQKPDQQQQTPKEKPKKHENKKGNAPKRVLKGGVVIQDLKEGSGDSAKSGKFVHVYYEGRLKENNKMFDSTTKGPGFSFRVGKGEVIKGWDIGLVGMKVGGKRRIICPPNVAYGPKGSPPVIPPNSTLIFDVDLRKIN